MNRVDYRKIKKPSRFILCSGTQSGKTYLCAHIIKHMRFDFVLILSTTCYDSSDVFYTTNLGCKKMIINDIDLGKKAAASILKQQTKYKKRGKKFNIAIVFDDFIESIKKNDRFLQTLYTRGRHYNCSVFTLTQKYMGLNPAIRANTEYLIFRFVKNTDFENIYEDYISELDIRKDTFKEYVKLYTTDFQFICLLNAIREDPNDKIFLSRC